MEITFLGHATIIIKFDNLSILIDPHLCSSYRSNLFGYYPERKINEEILHNVDIVIISHSHRDHFDINSLKKLRKDITVFIPNDARLQYALKLLEVEDVFLIYDWSTIQLSPKLRITWTPSTFRVPEHGILIEYDNINLWNMVDSHVTALWCEKILNLSKSKNIDFVLFPAQPLIEANTTHGLFPITKKNDIEEIKMVIDIIKPTFTIPFADGHYCLNEIKWINHHWIPFTESNKYEAIDYSSYKTQILKLDCADKLTINNRGNTISFNITSVPDYFLEYDFQKDRIFDPSNQLSAVYSNKNDEKISTSYIEKLFPNEEINLYKRFPSLKSVQFIDCNYRFLLINQEAEVCFKREFSFKNGSIKNDRIKNVNFVEIAISTEDFEKVYNSELSFSAILIGGKIREYHYFIDISQPVQIFRDFSDLISDCNFSFFMSGIFIFNQLLTINSKRPFEELKKEFLNQEYVSKKLAVQSKVKKKPVNLGSEKINRDFDQFVLCTLENYLLKNKTIAGVSGVYEYRGEKIYLGFLEKNLWHKHHKLEFEKAILFPFNFLYGQTIFGCGVQYPTELYSFFIQNIIESNIKTWEINTSILANFEVPNWRIANILPFKHSDILESLKRKGWAGVINDISSLDFPKNWWLGYPALKEKGKSFNVTHRVCGHQLIGTINQDFISKNTFKLQQSYRINYESEITPNKHKILNYIITGNVRLSWMFDGFKTENLLRQINYNALDDLIPEIVISNLTSIFYSDVC